MAHTTNNTTTVTTDNGQQRLHVPYPLHSRSCPDGQLALAPHDHNLDKENVLDRYLGNTSHE